MRARQRIGLPANPPELDEPGWDAGALYLEIDEPKPANPPWFGPSRAKLGTPVGQVHVISVHRGGEIRGYWIHEGALELRYPSTPHRWFSLDNAVQRALGMLVVDYGREHLEFADPEALP